MPAEHVVKEQLVQFGPVVDKLVLMTGEAREAFQHQNHKFLENLEHHKETLTQEISAKNKAITQLIRESGEKQVAFLRLQSILSHLNLIAETLEDLTEPLRKQIKEGVLFSDKAVSQTNFLFDRQTQILRSLADTIRTGNEFLKKHVIEESQKLSQACIEFASDHEARLVEGLCLPHAAPIFLGILDRMRTIAKHELEIIHLLSEVQ
jgi:Na+/phosphate symporter